MAANSTQAQKKMDYKQVEHFDVNEIAPDAPAGEWGVSIPPGKCKVQPTKEDKYPMLMVAVRLDKTEEDGEEFEKALGTVLTAMIVFFDDAKPRAARMSKLRLRQLCEAADVDLDVIPKKLTDPENDLEPLIKALERKKFTAWTRHTTRKDTGEVVTDLVFQNPNAPMKVAGDEEDEPEERPASKSRNGKGRR
jgi:hypothetical protein